jgi:Flp pilus assembly pilin Flp
MSTKFELLKKLHRDERGAEGLEKLLIISAIVLPLLGVLIWFRNDIKDWLKKKWDDARGVESTVDVANPFG